MPKNIIKTAILVLCFLAITSNLYAYDKGDFQIWNIDCEDVKVAKGVRLSMEQEFRFGENASEFFYQHYEWGVVFAFARMLELGFAYRLILERVKQKWMQEDQPNVSATLKYDLWKLSLDDRNRIEYRHFRFKDDSMRYRNRLTLKYPINFKKMTISPYLSDEIFVSSDGTGYSENRFCPGFEFELTKYVKTDIYYMLKSNKISSEKWTDANVLGTRVKVAF